MGEKNNEVPCFYRYITLRVVYQFCYVIETTD